MFDELERRGAEAVHLFSDPASGLRAVIAIHSTRRGPALGGCRFKPYPSFASAVDDALQLAEAMSLKAAMADLDYGGGKAVIVAPPDIHDRRALMLAFADAVNSLNGRYITAEDSGTTPADMDVIAERSAWVTGTSRAMPPSPLTALGVYEGLRAGVRLTLDRDDLHDVRVLVHGVGQVGTVLAEMLATAGAKLLLSDIDNARVGTLAEKLHATLIDPADVTTTPCDVFAPCAFGGVINQVSAERLACALVAGSANNQLADDAAGDILHRRNILYAPDFVINAGGLLCVTMAREGKTRAAIEQRVRGLGPRLATLWSQARQANIAPHSYAVAQARARLNDTRNRSAS